MKIIQLELSNIKSYQSEIINFNNGINCILGLNGSGKSTIIESIGYVLFNYNQGTSNNLLRYNESKGSISITFEGKDENVYKIIRNIKPKNSTVKIIDNTNNQVLFENVSDVYTFVKKVLGIPKEKSLSKLFEEIIAVPQGSFVNAFLETPKYRKENFDKLFDLDIYKDISDNVKKIYDQVEKEYIFNIEKEQSKYEGLLSNKEETKKEFETVVAKVESDKEKLDEIIQVFNEANKARTEVKEKIQKYNQLEKDYSFINNQLISLKEVTEITEKNIVSSRKAAKIIKENEFGYNLYLEATKKLEQNQQDFEKVILLESELSSNNNLLQGIKEKINILENLAHDLKVQKGLIKENILTKIKENSEKNDSIIKNKEKLDNLRLEFCEKSKEFNQQIAQYSLYKEKLNNAYQFLINFDKESLSYNLDEQINDAKEEIDKVLEAKESINKLNISKAETNSYLNSLLDNKELLSKQICPILKQPCLNIKSEGTHINFDSLIQEKQSELNKINSQINILMNEVNKEQQLLNKKELLELEKIRYLNNNEKYYQLVDDLKATFKIDDISNEIDVISQLMKKYDKSPNDNQLDNLRSDINLLESEIYSAKTIIEINKSAVDSLETEEREINTKLQKNLNDLNVSIQSIDDLNIRNSQICVKLEELKDVKNSIEENKQTISKFKASYEIYISNLNEAMSLEELLRKNQEHLLLKTQLEEKLKELKENYLLFDIKSLKDIEAKKDLAVNELSATISSLKTAISINEERKEVLEKELLKIKEYEERKEELKKELNKYQKLIEKLKLYRNIYNNLPRELSKQLRKYISSYASNLYRKISSENVVIEIMDDYEVVLIDCVDNSKMKHLSQLSGGEQMSVAISIRLAMLKQIANVEFYFMDEPTINLDYERRMMVAEVVKDMSNELRQLFVISHDDTFESITDNTIKIEKYNNTSKLC